MAEKTPPAGAPDPAKPKPNSRSATQIRNAAAAARSAAAQIPLIGSFQIGGRPRVLDPDEATLKKTMETLIGCAIIDCDDAETAAMLNVHPDTLTSFFDRYPNAKELFEDARKQGAVSLRRNQFDLSAKNPQMAIWLGMQRLGQKDPHKVEDLAARRAAEENKRLGADGRGPPINPRSLDAGQIAGLLERIRAAKAQKAEQARDVTPPVAPANSG